MYLSKESIFQQEIYLTSHPSDEDQKVKALLLHRDLMFGSAESFMGELTEKLELEVFVELCFTSRAEVIKTAKCCCSDETETQ